MAEGGRQEELSGGLSKGSSHSPTRGTALCSPPRESGLCCPSTVPPEGMPLAHECTQVVLNADRLKEDDVTTRLSRCGQARYQRSGWRGGSRWEKAPRTGLTDRWTGWQVCGRSDRQPGRPVGQPMEDTHLPRVGWPFPASHQVSTCPAVTYLCANLTPPSLEAPFLSASSSHASLIPRGLPSAYG